MDFNQVWSYSKSESCPNVVGYAKERGARALLEMDKFVKEASTLSEVPSIEQKEAAFEQIYRNPGQNFQRMAFTLQTPIKDRNDYVAVGRKLLLTDELPVGEIPAYDLDIPEYPAVIIGARANSPLVESNIQRVTVPTFSISITTSVLYEDITTRRYPAFDRAKERAAIAMAIAEDNQVFTILDEAANAGINAVYPKATGGVERGELAKVQGLMLANQLAPGAWLMNPVRYGDILTWSTAELDQVSLNVIVETGQFGVIHGTRLITSTRVNPRKAYLCTTPDKLGRIPERKSVEVKVVDWPKDTRWYITAWEQLGFAILNTAGVIAIDYQDANLTLPSRFPLS